MKEKELLGYLNKMDIKEYAGVFFDAHTIFKPSDFYDLGLPKDYVDQFIYNYQTDHTDLTGKGVITDHDGEIINDLEGVMAIRIAEDMASTLGLRKAMSEANSKFGRGATLRVLSGAIWQEAERKKNEIHKS